MRGGKKSERLREREDRSGWRLQQPDRVGLEVEWGWWSGLARSVIGGGGQIGQCIGEVGLECLWIGDEGRVGWDLQVCDACEEWAGGQ